MRIFAVSLAAAILVAVTGAPASVRAQAQTAPASSAAPAKAAPAAPGAQRRLDISKVAERKITGDFDSMIERRLIRVLVPYSRTLYYNDKGRERGITALPGARPGEARRGRLELPSTANRGALA